MKKLLIIILFSILCMVLVDSAIAQSRNPFHWENKSEQSSLTIQIIQTLGDHEAIAMICDYKSGSLIPISGYPIKIVTPESVSYKLYDGRIMQESFTYTGETYIYETINAETLQKIVRTVPVLMRSKEWKALTKDSSSNRFEAPY